MNCRFKESSMASLQPTSGGANDEEVKRSASKYDFAPLKKQGMRRYNPYEEIDEEEEGWSITREAKEAMRSSEYIREELADKGLQSLISDIVSSDGGWRGRFDALLEAKQNNPQFNRFLDKVLLTTRVLKREKMENGETLGFTLAPIDGHKIQRRKTNEEDHAKSSATENDKIGDNVSSSSDEDNSTEDITSSDENESLE